MLVLLPTCTYKLPQKINDSRANNKRILKIAVTNDVLLKPLFAGLTLIHNRTNSHRRTPLHHHFRQTWGFQPGRASAFFVPRLQSPETHKSPAATMFGYRAFWQLKILHVNGKLKKTVSLHLYLDFFYTNFGKRLDVNCGNGRGLPINFKQ